MMSLPIMNRVLKSLAVVVLSAVALSACSWLTPHRIDVRQGNHVTQAMVAQLRPGMTQEQVRFIMGSPLLVDVFHKDRWDYVYRFTPGRGAVEQRRLTLFFEEGKLKRLEGDVVAADGKPLTAEPQTPRVIEIAPEKR